MRRWIAALCIRALRHERFVRGRSRPRAAQGEGCPGAGARSAAHAAIRQSDRAAQRRRQRRQSRCAVFARARVPERRGRRRRPCTRAALLQSAAERGSGSGRVRAGRGACDEPDAPPGSGAAMAGALRQARVYPRRRGAAIRPTTACTRIPRRLGPGTADGLGDRLRAQERCGRTAPARADERRRARRVRP